LGQVLDNLLVNADQFSPAGEPVTVTADPSPEGVIVRVIDGGPGVPAALRERVFERFFRGPGDSDNSSGTGLGLAIVRGLVNAQGGRVWLEDSAPGEGGRFAFCLPNAASDPTESSEVTGGFAR
jgi:two-component system OmpR family sensor kinase